MAFFNSEEIPYKFKLNQLSIHYKANLTGIQDAI